MVGEGWLRICISSTLIISRAALVSGVESVIQLKFKKRNGKNMQAKTTKTRKFRLKSTTLALKLSKFKSSQLSL